MASAWLGLGRVGGLYRLMERALRAPNCYIWAPFGPKRRARSLTARGAQLIKGFYYPTRLARPWTKDI